MGDHNLTKLNLASYGVWFSYTMLAFYAFVGFFRFVYTIYVSL